MVNINTSKVTPNDPAATDLMILDNHNFQQMIKT